MVERYVQGWPQNTGTTFQEFSDAYVNVRICEDSETYETLDKRRCFDRPELVHNAHTLHKINITELFVADGSRTNNRILVVGNSGNGKTMLSMHIVDRWLHDDFLPNEIEYIFFIQLRHLLSIKKRCSMKDLFRFQHQLKPSLNVVEAYFQILSKDPSKILLILDGLDQITYLPVGEESFDFDTEVEIPTLISSIVRGDTIGSTRLLVTTRSGVNISYNAIDKKVDMFGFSREDISDYIAKFSGNDSHLEDSIKRYLVQNNSIHSHCYVPAQLDMVCHIVKVNTGLREKVYHPETIAELFAVYVRHIVTKHRREHSNGVKEKVTKIPDMKNVVLSHANIAKYGMEHVPIRSTFSKKEVQKYDFVDGSMACGLLTASEAYDPSAASVYYFMNLAIQEFLTAVAVMTDEKTLNQCVIKTASDKQLDRVIIFMAALTGNGRTNTFLDSMDLRRTSSVQELIELVVDRERSREDSIADSHNKPAAHKNSILFLIMIIYESHQPGLWRHVSHYVLNAGSMLDLQDQPLSSTEIQALAYILPGSCITSLM